jgi:hypothetical protein
MRESLHKLHGNPALPKQLYDRGVNMVEFNRFTGEIYKGTIFDILAHLDEIRKSVERTGVHPKSPPELDLYPLIKSEECSA